MTDRSRTDYLGEGGACLLLVGLLHILYYVPKWKAQTQTSGSRWWLHWRRHWRACVSFALPSLLDVACLCFMCKGIYDRWYGLSGVPDIMGLCAAAVAEFSITSSVFIEVCLPLQSFGKWFRMIIWSGALTSVVYVALVASFPFRLQTIWAAPGIFSLGIAAVFFLARQMTMDKQIRKLLLLWTCLATGAFVTALVLCLLDAFHLLPAGHPTIHCALGGAFLALKAYRPPKRFEQVGPPADAVSTVTKASLSVASYQLRRCEPGLGTRDPSTEQGMMPVFSDPRVISTPTRGSAFPPIIQPPLWPGVSAPPPTSASNTSFDSSTTAGSDAYRRCNVREMEFPVVFSLFRTDPVMIALLGARDEFLREIAKPRIPKSRGKPRTILHVSRGTQGWALDLAGFYPNAQVHCFDLAFEAKMLHMNNMTLYVDSEKGANWGHPGQFDVILLDRIDAAFTSLDTALQAAFICNRPGGWCLLEQLILCPPSETPESNSIWHAWKTALDCIETQKGLSFVLSDAKVAQ